MPKLPGASITYPTCGACHEETEYEDGEFYCDGCRIGYSGNSPEDPAYYRDEEDPQCGAISSKAPYDKYMEKQERWYRFFDHPCQLPKDHKPTGPWDDGHYYAGECEEIPAPE